MPGEDRRLSGSGLAEFGVFSASWQARSEPLHPRGATADA